MFKLNRKTEYALLALRYLSRRPEGERARVKEIADHYRIPTHVMAKVLQSLKANAIVTATTGPQGGYNLTRALDEISFASVFKCFSGSVGLVDCVEASACCQQDTFCDIQTPMLVLNMAIMSFLENITITDLFAAGLHQPQNLSLSRETASYEGIGRAVLRRQEQCKSGREHRAEVPDSV